MPSTDDAVSDTLPASEGRSISFSSTLRTWIPKLTSPSALCALVCLVYLFMFWQSVSAWWFNPRWTTDDALQQVYPFHSILHPENFKGDLITEVMRGYLAPLHYAIGYVLTRLCGNPLMTAHLMMLIQVLLSAGFLFLAVRAAAGMPAAFFSVLWFFHTRHVIQRMTAGLPRGWAPALFAAYLYFTLRGNHRAILAVILCGCLLNPPATFLVAASYGLYLLIQSARTTTRAEYLPHLIRLMVASPVFAGITLYIMHRPDYIGGIYSYSEAIKMPEFSRAGGRFSYLPFVPAAAELKSFALRTFFGKFSNPSPFWREYTLTIVCALLAAVTAVGAWRRRTAIPLSAWCFLVSSIVVYFIARLAAFYLYVPDRHINIPLAMFWIFALTVGVWRVLQTGTVAESPSENETFTWRRSWLSMSGLCAVAFVVYSGSQLNLSSNANFNYNDTRRGPWVRWLRENTPETSLIAGFPTFIDPVQLFSIRKGYATIETWHPFYTAYNEEMKRRLFISLRAHYAENLAELVNILSAEKIDYFVFERQRFYPDRLRNTRYFKIFQPLLDELTSRPPERYAFRQLPLQVDMQKFPFMPYRDKVSAVVDVRKLREFLQQQVSS
jgi:hypothetical protein